MGKRQPIAKSTRFEVFKRDSFTCQYCGRSAPDVLLEVDHINPVSSGGDNNVMNLITSCWDCNRGKGAKTLNDNSTIEKQKQQMDALNEKRIQLEMMIQWRQELLKLKDQEAQAVAEMFERLTSCKVTEHGIQELKNLLRKHSFSEVVDSVEESVTTYYKDYDESTKYKAFHYIGRICAIKKIDPQKPYLRDLFYIRGILRNRMTYINESEVMYLMEQAHLQAGVPIEHIKRLALQCKCWSTFKRELESLI